jgi:diaminohydroxyphosphoribosylaminopyrimidine deaminase / 5-amino-6-(5-phosphoribosylamino)uracil reductase
MASADEEWMRLALELARRGFGRTSPNPMVGAVLVRGRRELGRGWHHGAGLAHAEIEALHDARRRGHSPRGSTLYVTLEPCSTQGRTPPCTGALLMAGIGRVVVGATDPNPAHHGRGLRLLRRAGVEVALGPLTEDCVRLNEAFNHWIVQGTPWVMLKSAMTLDGRIADAAGRSRWITGPAARIHAHRLRAGADAILVGIGTILADDPALTVRGRWAGKPLRRIILDSRARTPLGAQVVTDAHRSLTTIVVSPRAAKSRVQALARHVGIRTAPVRDGRLDLAWVLRELGAEQVVSLLVEGGGEVNASFLEQGLVHRIAFFYAPKILGALDARPAVAGTGARDWSEVLRLRDSRRRRFGPDLFLTALVEPALRKAGIRPRRPQG